MSTAVASTVPPAAAVSEAIGKNAGGTMIAQAAVMAAKGPAAAAAKLGAGIVGTGAGAVAALGACAASVKQLEAAGVIKSGSAALASSLVAGGKTAQQALTSNMFTGKDGAPDLAGFIANPQAQVNVQISNMQTAQKGLTAAGLMTGKESPTQLAGMVMAGATAGVAAVTNMVRNPGATVTGSVLGSAAKTMASGNFAAGVASSITGGMSSISGALGSAVNSAKGIVGSAFAAVTGGFKAMVPGIPQNLAKLNNPAVLAGATQAGVSGLSSTIAAAASGAASGVNAIPGGVKAVSSLINSAKGAVDTVAGIGKPGALAALIPAGGAAALGAGGLMKLATTAASASAISPAAAASAVAQLTSAVSGQGGGGAVPEKIATVAINTMQTRTGMDAGLKSALGDKTPAPVYTGNPAAFGPTAGTTKVDTIASKKEAFDAFVIAAKKYQQEVGIPARDAYVTAKQSLPTGDPEIERLKTAYYAIRTKMLATQAEQDAMQAALIA